MNTALLVIDVQESFRQREYYAEHDLSAFLDAQNTLIKGCVSQGIPVIRVYHCDSDDPTDPFSQASGFIRPLTGLTDFESEAEFTKTRHSALVGTGLDVWLVRHGITRLLISGIRTEQCCETTARHASDLGWSVDYITEATLTFDITLSDGRSISAADIRDRTAAVLDGRFARVCSVQAALSGTG